MLSKDNLEEIKKIIKGFFEKTAFEVEIKSFSQKDLTLLVNLSVDNPQLLIGQGGETLFEIQHLLTAISKRKIKEAFYLDLDINEYKEKKIECLRELARSTADEVALIKKEKILSPMSAYERRIIHLEISKRTDVTSQSIGEEPERRVAVRPYP